MTAILVLLAAHWVLSIFAQTFFLHRYGAHRMFTMSRFWDRFFYLFAFVAQGPSFLIPRAYAYLHREHHAFADDEGDPHAPARHANVAAMMWHTKERYDAYAYRRTEPERRFRGGTPEWPALDALSQRWTMRIGFGALYAIFYLAFAPSVVWFALLPIHWLMGPIHGAIVNWCGHKYGYRNFATGDASRNTLPIDFVTMGELFQNNHHQRGAHPNFAARWFEIDPCYQVMRLLDVVGVIDLEGVPAARLPAEEAA
ncbi:MAG TPA: acyl-CoA desaturase [Polyangia bacterium]|nr:acyl-CoA desaturase [Polyangia bacterium]